MKNFIRDKLQSCSQCCSTWLVGGVVILPLYHKGKDLRRLLWFYLSTLSWEQSLFSNSNIDLVWQEKFLHGEEVGVSKGESKLSSEYT